MNGPWQPPHEQVPPGTNPSAPPGAPIYPGMPGAPMMHPYPPGMPPYGAPPGQYPGYYHPPPAQVSGTTILSNSSMYNVCLAMPYGQYGAPMPAPMPAGPSAPMAPVLELSAEDKLRLDIENSLGINRLVTCFVGNIADGVTDELLNTLFSVCGPVKKWKRMLEASGTPKSFGFLDYETAHGLTRLIKLLSSVPLLGKNLNIKIEDNTRLYLQKYQDALKEYELKNPNSPRLSLSLEEDLKALDELAGLFKQRNLVPAMQFIERKVQELTEGPLQEAEPVFEHPRQAEEQVRPEPKKQKKASLTGWETQGYRDRERRWEAREASMIKNRHQHISREAERFEREGVERLKLLEWIQNFDDSPFFHKAIDRLTLSDDREIEKSLASCNAPSFYLDRDRWRDRRRRDLARQLEHDEREKRREQETAERERKASMPSRPVSKKVRPPLIPISYTYEELMEASYDAESASAKLQDLKRDKIKALIAKIPTDQQALFAWDMDWDLIDMQKVTAWIKKNVDAWEEVGEKAVLCEDLESWIKERVPGDQIMQNIDGLPNADLFVMRLWRYLAYETEATGYALQ